MSGKRIALLIAFVALVTLPWWSPGSYYVNIASQILFYAIFALAIDVLLGYGGLVSLGHAGIFGISCYSVAVALGAGFGHFFAIVIAARRDPDRRGDLRSHFAARHRYWLSHDHARIGADHVGIGLSLDHDYERR